MVSLFLRFGLHHLWAAESPLRKTKSMEEKQSRPGLTPRLPWLGDPGGGEANTEHPHTLGRGLELGPKHPHLLIPRKDIPVSPSSDGNKS